MHVCTLQLTSLGSSPSLSSFPLILQSQTACHYSQEPAATDLCQSFYLSSLSIMFWKMAVTDSLGHTQVWHWPQNTLLTSRQNASEEGTIWGKSHCVSVLDGTGGGCGVPLNSEARWAAVPVPPNRSYPREATRKN